MRITKRTHVTRIVAIMVAAALAAGAVPAMASALGEDRGVVSPTRFEPSLPQAEESDSQGLKIAALEKEPAPFTLTGERASRAQAPLPAPVPTTVAATRTSPSSSAPQQAASSPSQTSSADRLAQARSIVARYARTHKYVAGTTVEFGDTRGNPQAIVYYKSKRIILNPNFTRDLETIIEHEVWHIIDWHHNNHIDWGCNLPPSNAGDFRL